MRYSPCGVHSYALPVSAWAIFATLRSPCPICAFVHATTVAKSAKKDGRESRFKKSSQNPKGADSMNAFGKY